MLTTSRPPHANPLGRGASTTQTGHPLCSVLLVWSSRRVQCQLAQDPETWKPSVLENRLQHDPSGWYDWFHNGICGKPRGKFFCSKNTPGTVSQTFLLAARLAKQLLAPTSLSPLPATHSLTPTLAPAPQQPWWQLFLLLPVTKQVTYWLKTKQNKKTRKKHDISILLSCWFITQWQKRFYHGKRGHSARAGRKSRGKCLAAVSCALTLLWTDVSVAFSYHLIWHHLDLSAASSWQCRGTVIFTPTQWGAEASRLCNSPSPCKPPFQVQVGLDTAAHSHLIPASLGRTCG